MTWFRIDDSFESHPKVKAIPRGRRKAVIGLWTLAGCWSARHLTNGHVGPHLLADWGATKADADLLVSVRLWDCTEDGYVFHNWAKWQPTRAQVEDRRDEWRQRQQRARARRAAQEAESNVHHL